MAFVDRIKEALDVSSAAAADVLTCWLMLNLAVAILVASYFFLRSRMGLGLQAIRDNKNAAHSVGVDPERPKALVFLLTAFGTGLCGALAFIQITRVTPDAGFSVIEWTAFVIFITIIGGSGLWGLLTDRTGIDFLPLTHRPPRRAAIQPQSSRRAA